MGATAPIDFEKDLIAPIDFSEKRGLKAICTHLSGLPFIEIPMTLFEDLAPID